MSAASLRALSHNTRSTHRSRNEYEKHRDARSRRSKSSRHSRSLPLTPIPRPWQPEQQPHSLNTTNITFFQEYPHHTSTHHSSSTRHTISSEPQNESHQRQQPIHTFPSTTDHLAAQGVESRLKRHPPHTNTKHSRILRNLITGPSHLDTSALWSILTAVDTLFFSTTLRGRVDIEWSSLPPYHTSLIGTTLLRPCQNPNDGIETLIILSKPILQDPKYDRRLLLSAFLHELIHCYLFVKCGFTACEQGGHTDGFHRIAKCIDEWVGVGQLSLCSMMANLSFFRKRKRSGSGSRSDRDENGSRGRGCEDREDEDEEYDYETRKMLREARKGCVKKSHDHGGCNQSPMYVREYYEDVVGDRGFESGGFVDHDYVN